MPPVLLQSLYFDLFSVGVEATIQQIVNITQEMNSFTPQHLGFSNLTYRLSKTPGKTLITISASHLMEPNPEMRIRLSNGEHEIAANLNHGQPFRHGFNKNLTFSDEITSNVFVIAPMGGAITPDLTMKIELSTINGADICIVGILHKVSQKNFKNIPRVGE
jgi:hypothetical protein